MQHDIFLAPPNPPKLFLQNYYRQRGGGGSPKKAQVWAGLIILLTLISICTFIWQSILDHFESDKYVSFIQDWIAKEKKCQ